MGGRRLIGLDAFCEVHEIRVLRRHRTRPWRTIVNRARALELLRDSKSTLLGRYGVTRLALFGSTARDGAGEDSDVDVLVAFDGPATSQRYFGVQFYLEYLLERPVDLVTEKALRPELRPFVEKEAVIV